MAIHPILIAALLVSAQTALPFVPASVPIDNALARVELSATAPGAPGRPHDHPTSRVLIYFNPGANDITFQDGTRRHEVFDTGTVLWNDAMGIHTALISGPAPVNLVHVELKAPPGQAPAMGYPARDPLTVAPDHYTREIENNQVRVLRLRLGPGEKTAMQDERFERLVVPITPGRLAVAGPDGRVHTTVWRQAGLQWQMPGREADRNIGDTPFEAVIVEFRK